MINTSVVVEDNQVVRLILEFLDSRKLHNTMRTLEKEAGIVNCGFSDDILFLRDLVLDGEWEAVLIFAQPFEGIDGFDSKQFRYLVLKQKFMEVLYFKSGFGGNSTSYSIEDLIKCLNQLEEDCPSKTEYSKLCWLLTVPNLSEQSEYHDWNPATARLNCFEQLLDILKKVIPLEKKSLNGKLPRTLTPIKERLLHLLIKGLCFESCVDYCQLRAINGSISQDLHVCVGDNILNGPSQESSGNFLSWLQNLAQEAFITPFEPVSLEVDLKKVKQAPNIVFHKSPKRDDAEILSRSLSLSGRPATADIASHLSALAVEKHRTAISDNRPHSTQPPKGVSRSYNEFHYKSTIPDKRPLANAGENGFSHDKPATQEQNKQGKSTLDSAPNITSDNIVYQNHQLIITGAENVVEPSRDSVDIHALKEKQQQELQEQLEAYQRHKQELERQLLELSLTETWRTANGEELSTDEMPGKRPESSGSFRNMRNEHLSRNDDLKHFQEHKHHKTNEVFTTDNHELLNANSAQDVNAVNLNPKFEQQNSSSFTVTQSMTSTPARRIKGKPEDLKLGETKVDSTVADAIPVTPAEQTFPNTPLVNGPAILSAGHWVALADGSGVLNTSTPKATRQGMTSTPAPPASPVLSVDGTTPRGLPASKAVDGPNVVTKIGGTAGEQAMPSDVVKDKENTDSLNHQATVKRGPKVNGVRRSLVPSSRQKAGAEEENKQIRIAAQGLDTIAQLRLGFSDQSSAGPHAHPNRQQESVQQSTRVNGQPPKTGTTFVVDVSSAREVTSENYPQGIKQLHNGANNETPKGRDSGTVNTTFRKPSTNTPPNNTTVTHSKRVPLLEKQREILEYPSDLKFYTVATLEDVQAIRAIAFHPSGDLFAVGSNSKTLRVCTAEGLHSQQRVERSVHDQPPQPTILFKSNRHHRGSIYCIAWSATGDIIATGSNDKSIKMMKFDVETCSVTWPGLELAIHSGTVRDLAFVSRASGTPVLVSGGAGDGNIMISDCSTGQTVGQLKGHSGHIMSVYADSDDIIASGSADNTVRLWDLRSQRCIDAIATGDSCVASVCVNSSGNMLASGHEDGSCMIYDITAGRTLQLFTPHTMDCRSVRFSPDNNFLLTGSYDTSIIMMDIRKDLELNIPPYTVVAHHRDKVIQCRWHPSLLAFLSSSADRTVNLWAPES